MTYDNYLVERKNAYDKKDIWTEDRMNDPEYTELEERLKRAQTDRNAAHAIWFKDQGDEVKSAALDDAELALEEAQDRLYEYEDGLEISYYEQRLTFF